MCTGSAQATQGRTKSNSVDSTDKATTMTMATMSGAFESSGNVIKFERLIRMLLKMLIVTGGLRRFRLVISHLNFSATRDMACLNYPYDLTGD